MVSYIQSVSVYFINLLSQRAACSNFSSFARTLEVNCGIDGGGELWD